MDYQIFEQLSVQDFRERVDRYYSGDKRISEIRIHFEIEGSLFDISVQQYKKIIADKATHITSDPDYITRIFEAFLRCIAAEKDVVAATTIFVTTEEQVGSIEPVLIVDFRNQQNQILYIIDRDVAGKLYRQEIEEPVAGLDVFGKETSISINDQNVTNLINSVYDDFLKSKEATFQKLK